jgi:Tol biopolymer transport system component
MLAPQWSPDGQQIVFGIGGFSPFLDFAIGGKKPVDPVNCGAQVALINADGAGFHLITSGPNNNAFAAFSPDGKIPRLPHRRPRRRRPPYHAAESDRWPG